MSLQTHFMSRQTYLHATLECHSVALHVKMFREQCPSQPTDHEETGSQGCEETFSSFGPHGRVGGRQKVYTYLRALDSAGDENQLRLWESDPDPAVALQYGRANERKMSIPIELHEPAGARAADLTVHPNDAEQVHGWEAGLRAARDNAVAEAELLLLWPHPTPSPSIT